MYIRGVVFKAAITEFLGQQQAEPGFVSFGGAGLDRKVGKLARVGRRPRSTPQAFLSFVRPLQGFSSVRVDRTLWLALDTLSLKIHRNRKSDSDSSLKGWRG